MAAGGVGPPPRGPLAGRVAGFDSAVPSVLALPPWPALSVPFRPPPCFRYRLFSGGRRAPPFQCFRSVSVAPGRGCRRYRRLQPYRPAPPSQRLVVLCPVPGTVGSCPTAPPARLVLSFGLLSAADGRRGFRSSCEKISHNARNRNKGSPSCVVSRRYRRPLIRPLDR